MVVVELTVQIRCHGAPALHCAQTYFRMTDSSPVPVSAGQGTRASGGRLMVRINIYKYNSIAPYYCKWPTRPRLYCCTSPVFFCFGQFSTLSSFLVVCMFVKLSYLCCYCSVFLCYFLCLSINNTWCCHSTHPAVCFPRFLLFLCVSVLPLPVRCTNYFYT